MDTQHQHGTFDLYERLPPLPVPPLADTCARYLATVEPLVDAATFADVSAAVAELQAPGGVGERLQAALEARAARMDNWLSDWWDEAAYLNWPSPVPINSSIAIAGHVEQKTGDQVVRAAEVTAGAVAYHLAIQSNTFPPEVQRDGSPLDMSLLKRFFATTRVPGLERDRLLTFGPDESRHIVVIREGRMFAFDVVDANGSPLAFEDLVAQFRRVIEMADGAADEAPAPVAALTAVDRPTWARMRTRLSDSPINRRSIDALERALFHICLDRGSHEDPTALGAAGLHGTPGNRWFDKTLTLVIDADGRMVLHGEHSPVDAGAWCPLLDAISEPKAMSVGAVTTSAREPERLGWSLTDADLETVTAAAARFQTAIDDLDMQVFAFDAFGKDLIKTFKMGPDPLVQMAFQIAYQREQGRLPKTYESASTRSCRLGRTETIRVASNEARALALAMDDPAMSAADRIARARAAFAEHSRRGRDASAGFGVDRHMLGLKLIAPEAGVAEADLPRLFAMPIHTLGWELTTAQVPLATAFVNHFGPVMPTGYAIAYVIKPDAINMSVASFRSEPSTDTTRFREGVVQALHDLKALMQSETA